MAEDFCKTFIHRFDSDRRLQIKSLRPADLAALFRLASLLGHLLPAAEASDFENAACGSKNRTLNGTER
jgi:hypothetical protein